MNKESITDKQGIALVILFVAGTATAYPIAKSAGKDIWLAILLAIAAVFIAATVYARILSLYPKKNLYDILESVFGRFIGKGLTLLFTWFAFHIGVLICAGYGDFMITVSLPETPKMAPSIFIILLSIWGVKEGIEVLGRWAEFFVIINFPLPILSILMLIPQMEISNIRPVLYHGMGPVITGAFEAFAFPFAEAIVFMMVASSFKEKKSAYRVYYGGLAVGGILTLGVSLSEMLVLGPDIHAVSYFPSHSAVTKINIGDLVHRLEVITIIFTYTAAFIQLSICLLAATIGIAKLTNLDDYRSIVCPVGLLMLNMAYFIHGNIMESVDWGEKIWRYYALPFQVILPFMILIAAEIKARRQKQEV